MSHEEGDLKRWRPLSRTQRRVLGVLVEKAKTTPDAYPMTLNSLTNGCNQKSNRSPQMNLDTDDVEIALDELREMGALAEIVGGGRVAKYRHYAYEWLGVDKFELAVITELLLRGEQTVGELRGRAARMEPIPDISALRPIIQSLVDKGLAVALTPAGRGQIVTHDLYLEDEMNQLRKRVSSAAAESPAPVASAAPRSAAASVAAPPSPSGDVLNEIAELKTRVSQLEAQLQQIEQRIEGL